MTLRSTFGATGTSLPQFQAAMPFHVENFPAGATDKIAEFLRHLRFHGFEVTHVVPFTAYRSPRENFQHQEAMIQIHAKKAG